MYQKGELNDESFWIPNSLDRETGKGIYHSEWRSYLNEINQNEVSRLLKEPSNAQRFVLFTRYVAEYFQNAARELLMPLEVFYLAMDIFDRFGFYGSLIRLCRFWVSYFCRSGEKQDGRLAELTAEPQIFRRSICLISLSCIQLASKQCYANKVLPVPVIVEMMKKFGFAVQQKDVMITELKVFQMIRWAMPTVTVLTYVEMFVEQMTTLLSGISRSEIIQVCAKVLNVAVTFHKEIYTKLHIAFKRRELRTDREKSLFLSVEGDSIRLAASVVCTSGMLYDPSEKLFECMIEHIAKTTIYQMVEIRVLSQIIMHIILRKMNLNSQ